MNLKLTKPAPTDIRLRQTTGFHGEQLKSDPQAPMNNAYIFVEGDKKRRDWIMSSINKRGVKCYQGSCSEVYLEKAFKKTNLRPHTRLSIAKKLGQTSLMFLCDPALSAEEMRQTCSAIYEVSQALEQ